MNILSVFSFRFGNVEPERWPITPATGFGVMHMERDLFVPGNILYLESHALMTLNLNTNESTLIAGSITNTGFNNGIGNAARFDGPFAFLQLDSSMVVISDRNNHCFRTVSRLTNATSTFAGACEARGDIDGPFTSAKMQLPESMVKISPNEILFTDFSVASIRKLDISTNQVSLVVQLNESAHGLAQQPGSHNLIFSVYGVLLRLNLDTLNVNYLTQTSSHGSVDGPLGSSVFHRKPESLAFLDSDVMIAAGFQSHLVRVVDFAELYVSSICQLSNANEVQAGTISSCKMDYPRSLLVLPELNRILVGFHESIGFIELFMTSGISTTANIPTTTPLTTTLSTTTPRTTTTISATTTASTTTTTPTTTTSPTSTTTTPLTTTSTTTPITTTSTTTRITTPTTTQNTSFALSDSTTLSGAPRTTAESTDTPGSGVATTPNAYSDTPTTSSLKSRELHSK